MCQAQTNSAMKTIVAMTGIAIQGIMKIGSTTIILVAVLVETRAEIGMAQAVLVVLEV